MSKTSKELQQLCVMCFGTTFMLIVWCLKDCFGYFSQISYCNYDIVFFSLNFCVMNTKMSMSIPIHICVFKFFWEMITILAKNRYEFESKWPLFIFIYFQTIYKLHHPYIIMMCNISFTLLQIHFFSQPYKYDIQTS